MPLKQQTLANSFDRRPTRRLVRIGSHNAKWESIESDDIFELLTDAAMKHSYWQSLLTLRQLSRTFRRIVNAKLDALLVGLRSKADAARAGDASELESIRSPRWHPAATAYREALEQLLDHRLARSLTINRANMGFWLVRDELIAWKMNACICCKKLCRPEHKDDGYKSFVFPLMQGREVPMGPVHFTYPRSTCAPLVRLTSKRETGKRAEAILETPPQWNAHCVLPHDHVIPATQKHPLELFKLLRRWIHAPDQRDDEKLYWVDPVPFLPTRLTLAGACGMSSVDVDRLVAAEEAAKAIAAAEREAERTAKRDAEVAKLEAAAEAYLSANVPSIPTLSRLQDLEAFYGMGHAIPTRPLPSHRKLPFSQVCIFEIRMRLFRKHVELLS